MKTALLALVLALAGVSISSADSALSEFRQSYKGTAVLSSGPDSLSGTSAASFNASLKNEQGRFSVGSVFRSGDSTIPLPNSMRFRNRKITLSLGAGITAATGRVTTSGSTIKFSASSTLQGSPILVIGKIKRTDHGLQVEQKIYAQGREQTLTYKLKSKRPPGEDPGNPTYEMPGGDPSTGSSNASGDLVWGNGAAAFAQRLSSSGSAVRIETIAPNAYEKEGTPAVLRVSRADTFGPIDVYFDLSGNTDARKGSASPADYRLEDAAGHAVANRVTIPNGASSIDLEVHPLADGLHEVPETLSVNLRPAAGYQLSASSNATVTISDATQDPANDNIFIAYLSPGAGVTSAASGISTVHLLGDNSTALVDLSFSGLTSAQSAAHIYAPTSSGGTGPDIKGLPRGQVESSAWPIAAAQFLATDQAALDALYSGQLSVTVLTGNYPDGEIRGNYVMSSASADPPLPADPPAVGPLTGEALRRDVSRFLMQATFGPTQDQIDALAADIESRDGDRLAGYSAWIDQQFALEQTRLLDYVQAADAQEWSLRGTDPINYVSGNEPGNSNRRRGWWALAVKAGDQLRQRVAFALSEIFVVSEYDDEVLNRHYGLANYYDLLGRYADGNYRALLGEISRNPIMGHYLSSLKNQKAIVDSTGKVLVSPDENYAREVMQLFSIGLVALNADGSVRLSSAGKPTPTYTNADITELARVLTGWSFSKVHGAKASGYPVQDNTNFNAGYGPLYFQSSWLNPMKNFPNYHDSAAKTVLGNAIPAGLTGDQDLDKALDILATHPNTGPFLSRLLIQRLVTSNPSAGYIYRVAKVFADDGAGQRGNLKAVIKAILLDYEARDASVALQVSHGKQKEPLLRYVQLLRALVGGSAMPLSDLSSFGYPASQLDNFPSGTTLYRYANTDTPLGQSPQRSPTVFNWYLPDYSPPGKIAAAGLFAPEMQITTETQVSQIVNYARTFTESDTGQSTNSLFGATDTTLDDVKIDRSPQVNEYKSLIAAGKSVTEAVTAVVDDLDLLLSGGRLKERYATAATPNPRSIIIDTAVATTESPTGNERVKAILYLVSNSPTAIHQQ
jgi:uncharacterized protein (DUF1800 family)